jgi:hypothetical protein
LSIDLSGKWLKIKRKYVTKKMLSGTKNSISMSILFYENSGIPGGNQSAVMPPFLMAIGKMSGVFIFFVWKLMTK